MSIKTKLAKLEKRAASTLAKIGTHLVITDAGTYVHPHVLAPYRFFTKAERAELDDFGFRDVVVPRQFRPPGRCLFRPRDGAPHHDAEARAEAERRIAALPVTDDIAAIGAKDTVVRCHLGEFVPTAPKASASRVHGAVLRERGFQRIQFRAHRRNPEVWYKGTATVEEVSAAVAHAIVIGRLEALIADPSDDPADLPSRAVIHKGWCHVTPDALGVPWAPRTREAVEGAGFVRHVFKRRTTYRKVTK